MSRGASYDAVVIGAGPNGLAAAITLARAGRSVLLREGGATVGGSCRSAPLTLGGFVHDVCSTVHALAALSPFLQSLPLAQLGVEFMRPALAFAHPQEDGSAAAVCESVEQTAEGLGIDADGYRRLMAPLVDRRATLMPLLLGPPRMTRHALLLARFGWRGLRGARGLAEAYFETPAARALFAGAAAHAMVPLDRPATAAFGLVLTIAAHAGGWPVVRGGSQVLADAMAAHLRSLGGAIELNAAVTTLEELPRSKVVLCDVTPRQLLRLAGDRLPASYRIRLGRFRYGPGAFKMDWALDGPIPWRAAACARAGTVHLGGTLEDLCEAEQAPWSGRIARRPYVLLVQPSLFDPTRAPAGHHTAWAYCHVPNGSDVDMTDPIEDQIERFAPGFRRRIMARHVMAPAELQRHNPNLIGGDIGGGSQELSQIIARPTLAVHPYATPADGLYLCSSSTPPGGGVHGMCGYHAASLALRRELK